MGVGSLPVRLGAPSAARTACALMILPQIAVLVLLLHWQAPWHALTTGVLIIAQWPLMYRFLQQPVQKALMLSALGVPLYVSNMMVSAWALRMSQGAFT